MSNAATYKSEIGHLTRVTLWRLRKVLPEADVQRFLASARDNPEELAELTWHGQPAWLEHDVRAWWAAHIDKDVLVSDHYAPQLEVIPSYPLMPGKRLPAPTTGFTEDDAQKLIDKFVPLPVATGAFDPVQALTDELWGYYRLSVSWKRDEVKDLWQMGTSWANIKVTASLLRTVTPLNKRIVAEHLHNLLCKALPMPVKDYITRKAKQLQRASDQALSGDGSAIVKLQD